jgi:ferric-dicitrate binding protein FerR (iron transport regulator)
MTDYSTFEVEDFLHDDFFIDWVVKQQPDHAAFWLEWLALHPEKQSVVEEAASMVKSLKIKPLEVSLSDARVDELVNSLQQRISRQPVTEKTPVPIYKTMWFRAAAAVLLFGTIGIGLYTSRNENIISKPAVAALADDFLNVSNQTDTTQLVRMNDGSLAVLKPASSLRYPAKFGNTREVFLTGEAFFEVHKNPAKPFLVHNGNVVVRVLGTSFTVKRIEGRKDVKVVVNTGRVAVYDGAAAAKDPKHSNQIILTPNQQVVYSAEKLDNKKELLSRPLVLSKERAVKEFTFDNTPVITVIEKINQAYGVNIEYDREKLEKLTITTSISEKPLDEKVRIICKALDMDCHFTDGRIIIGSPNDKTNSDK